MSGRDADLALLKRLLEADQHPGKTPALQRRGAAVVALVLLCGAPIAMLPRLKRRHWRPGERDEIVLDPDDHYDERRAVKARTVPLVETAKIVVERYLAAVDPAGSADPDTPLLQAMRGGPCVHNALDDGFDRAVTRLGRPDLKLGRLHALFQTLIEEAGPRRDGAVEFLIGEDRRDHAPFRLAEPPPPERLRALLDAALPLAAPWRLLTHEAAGRGRKRQKLAPRANKKRGVA